MADLQELETLHSLYQKGILSDKDYEIQKARILGAVEAAARPAEMVPMGEAYKLYWKKSFVWKGRATRAEYWWPVLINSLIGAATGFLVGLLSGNPVVIVLAVAYFLFYIATIFPGLAVLVRRFHDRNKSAWFAFMPLWLSLISYALLAIMPILGLISVFCLSVSGIVMFVYLLLPSNKFTNMYGDPR